MADETGVRPGGPQIETTSELGGTKKFRANFIDQSILIRNNKSNGLDGVVLMKLASARMV